MSAAPVGRCTLGEPSLSNSFRPSASESSFPSLEAVLRRLNDPGAATLFKLLEQQTNIEKKVRDGEDKAVGAICLAI